MADYNSTHTGTEVDAAITTVQDYVETYKAKIVHLADVTSAIQAQLDLKQASGSYVTTTGDNTLTGKNTFGTVAEFDNGTTKKLGFFGETAVVKQSMLADYVLTQAEVAGTTAEDLTDNTGGTAAGSTLVAIGETYAQAEVANNMAVMAKMIDALTVTVGSLTTELNKAKTDIAALQDRIEELVGINAAFGLAAQP